MYELKVFALETVSGVELTMSISEVTGPSGGGRRGTTGYTRTVPWDEVPDHPAGFPGWVAEVLKHQAYRLRAD